MKKLLLSSALVFALIGCGGTDKKETPKSTIYKGAVTKGDFATFTLTNSTLSYKIDPSSSYYPGISGSLSLSNPFGKFFKDSSVDANILITDNLLIGKIPQDTSNAYVVALQSNNSINKDNIASKTYIYSHIDSNNNITLNTLRVNPNGTYSQYNINTDVVSSGCWKTNNGHIVAKDGINDCTNVDSFDYNIVIKAGNKSAIIIDYANGDGVGIGLEQRALTNSDINGTYYSYYYEQYTDNFAKIEIDNNNTVKWKMCPNGYCTSPWASGNLNLNQDCLGNPLNGVACADIGGNKYLTFIDSKDGYYMAISAENTPFHVEVGSK